MRGRWTWAVLERVLGEGGQLQDGLQDGLPDGQARARLGRQDRGGQEVAGEA